MTAETPEASAVPIVIDHVDALKLDKDEDSKYANELRAMAYLAEGLQFLNRQVAKAEQHVREALDPNMRFTIFGNHPVLNMVTQGLIASSFHWYAVSACNYVKMVGWLAMGEDTQRSTDYVKQVIPQVYVWRNKVGAHFARTDPRPEDTPADLAASVMFPIAFDDDAFWTGTFPLAMTRGGQSSSSRTDMRWSLTRTHRELSERYWPNPVNRNKESD